MTTSGTPDPALVRPGAPESDAAVELVEARLGLLFNQMRSVWKDSAALVDPGLQPAGYKLLATVVRLGPLPPSALAELLMTDKSAISRQLRVLEELGFVESHADQSDRRARVISATPLAVERVDAVRDDHKAKLYRYLETWTQDELGTFAELLGRLGMID